MLYECTAVSQKPEKAIENEITALRDERKMSVDMFYRDPYMLDFLGLKDTYSEKDLENTILSELEKFILEMGSDFAFLARQKHFVLEGKDYYMDLLFYHRSLHRLVLIELKLGEFEPQDKGQVELYLRWFERNEKAEVGIAGANVLGQMGANGATGMSGDGSMNMAGKAMPKNTETVYYVVMNGKAEGPYSITEVSRLIAEKKVVKETYIRKPWNKRDFITKMIQKVDAPKNLGLCATNVKVGLH